MNIKQKILRTAIALFVVLSSSLTIGKTLAYWVEVTSDTEVTTGTVNTGDWNQAFPWDPNETYQVGDLVTNNGSTYEAKKDAPTREPGVTGGWKSEWNQL